MTIFSFDRDSLRSALERVFAAEKSNGSLVQLVFLDVKLVMDQVLVFWREVGGGQIWGTFVDPTEVLTTMKDEPDLLDSRPGFSTPSLNRLNPM